MDQKKHIVSALGMLRITKLGFNICMTARHLSLFKFFLSAHSFPVQIFTQGTVFVKDGDIEGKEEESSISGWFNQGRFLGDTTSYDGH